ncbi:Glycosyl transferase family 11 [Butyrivibrio fibrisolvens]|uniref:Glycosyl transferase family 11 n=1 Tax=Butyrivibrio fibrisolvens TaxID=831 RepID=A0A1H9Q3Q3_BUTFI|nr:alpha-1,2-fucosyltransferase [Butyrivibrio fibrisolvens]SER55048.1 Glycosyl transferase family 11 [Butyrivibrio fibrisolvens]
MKRKPKVHLYIRGNCGNQFFQYAFARHLQEILDADLIINYNKVINSGKNIFKESDNLLKDYNTVPYKYEANVGFGGYVLKFLKLFHFILRLETFQKRTYKFFLVCAKILPFFGIYYFDAAFYPFKIYKRKNIYVNGYFESPRYFADIDEKIKKELLPKPELLESNKELFNIISSTESICVTIKRRDLDKEVYQYNMSYFYNAIDYIMSRLNNPTFIIFSDDVDWCRDNVHIDAAVYYETPDNPIWEKIRLMSSCKHFIIHNSTFSWWAQHLSDNTDKIVVAPSKWMIRDDQPIDIYEDSWIYLTPEGKIVDQHE